MWDFNELPLLYKKKTKKINKLFNDIQETTKPEHLYNKTMQRGHDLNKRGKKPQLDDGHKTSEKVSKTLSTTYYLSRIPFQSK